MKGDMRGDMGESGRYGVIGGYGGDMGAACGPA